MRWYLGAVAVLLIGLALDLGLLVYAMYVLLGIMLISRYLAREWIENITAERDCSRLSAQMGEKVAVIVEISNRGTLPVPWLLLEDSLPKEALLQRPPRIRIEQRRTHIMRLKAGGKKTLLYQIQFLMRGYYQLGPLLAETGDLFGLHRRYRVLTEPHFVLVYPKVLPLESYNLASRRPIGEVRIMHRLFEDPTRISGVRPYGHGDPLNRIHWRATARMGELHSKTYEPSSVAGATILLDFNRRNYPARNEPHRSELAVTTAASLGNALYQMGQQVGLMTNGRDAADRIREEGWRSDFYTREMAQSKLGMRESSDRLRPVEVATRRGADQLTRMLESLARIELSDGLDFAALVSEVTSQLPLDATVVAVLPDVSPETAIALGNLRRRGFAVTAVMVMYDDEGHYPDCVGRLLAEGIDARRVEDEETLSVFCGEQLV